jgi:SAM-dependent methyltransferase
MSDSARPIPEWLLSKTFRRRVVRRLRSLTLKPAVGRIEFGDLRRLHPISADWGFDRGTVIDRYYIDRFMSRYAVDVRGHVLEVGTDSMMRRYGGSRIVRSDVLHVAHSGPPVTIVGDLADGAHLSSETFDCVIVTQTLHVVYDVPGVVRTLHRILRPGGVALVTVPGITKISRHDMDRWGQFWCFTTKSARRLFEECFPADGVTVDAAGNVLAATAFLQGIAAEELTTEELEYRDPDFETLIGIRAERGPTG